MKGRRVNAAAERAGQDQGSICFLRLPGLPVELYRRADVVQATPRHVHEVFALTVAERGIAIERRKAGPHRMVPGSIAVINCGEAHAGDVPAGRDYSSRTIRLASQLMRGYVEQLTGQSQVELPVRQPVFHDAALARFVGLTCRRLEQPGTRLEQECSILAVLSMLHQRHGHAAPLPLSGGDARPSIRRARDFLQECPGEDVSLAQLAALAGMSPFHFAKVFAQCFGVPPHAFQIHVRLSKATELLAAGKPQVEVALETGFCDQSHFCRAFKKRFGIPPGQYGRLPNR